ncbi:hypothetical protein LSTR_LSTR006599 [Laodelphax striatellus]|uniref:C2H2-type domain-containing protein n=1 Tax=Laodelphax striatellus TaxID=195883 RepID=A0A482X0E4_LAOST|nr:hypothetical protein LSTR_LSTR006599 [Laodelphax striatellus]
MSEKVLKAIQFSATSTPTMALLAEFRVKVEEAINLVPQMGTEETFDAVECWNVFSEKLQEIVHRSVEFAEIEAIALSMEEPGHDNSSNKTDCVVIDFIRTTSKTQEITGAKNREKTDGMIERLTNNTLINDVNGLVDCSEASKLDCLEQGSENSLDKMRKKTKTNSISEKKTNDKELRESEKEKSWECSVCSNRFKQRKSLKVHMRKHTGIRPYECGICGKTFTQSGTLLSHRAVHTDARPHACAQCGRAFRQRSQLRTHQLRHDKVKRFECAKCTFKFLTRDAALTLSTSERTTSSEVPATLSTL